MNVRLLDAETAMLAKLADREGLTVSEWIRNTIRVQHALAFGQPSAKRKPKK